jgi:hypothetical protein
LLRIHSSKFSNNLPMRKEDWLRPVASTWQHCWVHCLLYWRALIVSYEWNYLVYKLRFGRILYTIEFFNVLISTRLFVNNEILNCNQTNMLLVLDINICTFVITLSNTHHNLSWLHLHYSVRLKITIIALGK